ncbi:LOW QUALITY PROTEIN: uncharacterized protein LOC124959244 [Sciurus carolinensis]|uniref:LOW QUALITY PROTEIN: uncharacterized protein LOC124959244 n=1 Tax=Sciurus carolinensis TaxID=30640 RepID=UPI001FB4A79B|nr:LOW QUALITY PROTEIN: uncharacterized protein LOC124959244 [Sciurus carolinensis]
MEHPPASNMEAQLERLAPKSQELFAFEWTDIDGGINGQLTWTRLPQGFKNSPTLFDEALHEDLGEFRQKHPNLTLLQYVDDLLIAAENRDECIQGTENLLQTLGTLGYRASAKKAQIYRPEVTYLGYLLREGKRWLTPARKETVLRIPKPQSPRQVREFLGSAGFCRLWIPGFAELAKPLYEATKDKQPFNWTTEADTAFQQIKDALLSAPALGLPDVVKPFSLYIDESKGIAKGVLTQYLGPWRRPVAYLSKKLDPVAVGWPPCLRMIAATALMVKDADKLTMGQELHVITPHAIEGILRQPPDRWLSNARLTHYQSLLLNPLRIIFQAPSALNPATLLPDPDLDSPIHDCSEILAQVHGLREDLQDHPLFDTDAVWFTDGSSFLHQGQRYAGAAVVTETEVIWAEPLPMGTSAQKAELIAMTKALTLGKDKKLTVYMDSRYAFATAHIHGAIYRERGMLTAEGKSIKNKEEIVSLIDALWLPKKLAIVHCPGHQKPSDPVSRGNCLADQVARNVALQRDLITVAQLPDSGPRTLPKDPTYTEEDLSWIHQQPLAQCLDGWWKDSENRIILPELMGQKVLCRLHRTTHMGTRKLQDLVLQAGIKIKGVQNKIEQIVKNCRVYKLTNAGYSKCESGNRLRGDRPGAYWEVDFTEVKPGRYGYKYLLVFVDTFSGWVEAFPTKRETAQTVAKKILEDLLPRYGFPVTAAPVFGVTNFSPYQPYEITWEISNPTAKVPSLTVTEHHPLWTWWPELQVDLCTLANGAFSVGTGTISVDEGLHLSKRALTDTVSGKTRNFNCAHTHGREELQRLPFYVCPGYSHQKECGGEESYFCAKWGCETTGQAYWIKASRDLIEVKRGKKTVSCNNRCNHLSITFTDKGRQDKQWMRTRSWGLRLYAEGPDMGIVFTVRMVIKFFTQPLGPNLILHPPAQRVPVIPPTRGPRIIKLVTSLPNTPQPTTHSLSTPYLRTNQPHTQSIVDSILTEAHPLLSLLSRSFLVLNATYPNWTRSCWLCYDTVPPYYEGVAVQAHVTTSTKLQDCRWRSTQSLTLEQVSGQGLCLGAVPYAS